RRRASAPSGRRSADLGGQHPARRRRAEEPLRAAGAALTLGENLLTAASGEEALRHALKNDFAVILLDVRMPGIDGFETARLIRNRERSRLTPIIFLTAAADEMTSMFRGYEVGAVDY